MSDPPPDGRDLDPELTKAVYVGARFVDRTPTALGTEYDHAIEAVVGVRIAGLHYSEWGHVDPDGAAGIPWDVLVRRIRRAILSGRTFPDAGDQHTTYTDCQFQNESDQSDDWQDHYRYDVDVIFNGYEELP